MRTSIKSANATCSPRHVILPGTGSRLRRVGGAGAGSRLHASAARALEACRIAITAAPRAVHVARHGVDTVSASAPDVLERVVVVDKPYPESEVYDVLEYTSSSWPLQVQLAGGNKAPLILSRPADMMQAKQQQYTSKRAQERSVRMQQTETKSYSMCSAYVVTTNVHT